MVPMYLTFFKSFEGVQEYLKTHEKNLQWVVFQVKHPSALLVRLGYWMSPSYSFYFPDTELRLCCSPPWQLPSPNTPFFQSLSQMLHPLEICILEGVGVDYHPFFFVLVIVSLFWLKHSVMEAAALLQEYFLIDLNEQAHSARRDWLMTRHMTEMLADIWWGLLAKWLSYSLVEILFVFWMLKRKQTTPPQILLPSCNDKECKFR